MLKGIIALLARGISVLGIPIAFIIVGVLVAAAYILFPEQVKAHSD